MNKIKLRNKQENKFIDYFISKEREFLFSINADAFYDKDFKFYMGWFIYAINDYMEEKYDIEERFIYFFVNNYSLNINFFPYMMNEEFIKRVMEDIREYKREYNQSIYG